MLITVKMELSFEDLESECWSGAIDTLKTIREHDMQNEFMNLISDMYCDEYPTLTTINDLLWFDDIYIFECLGIIPDDDDDDDYEDEEDDDDYDDDDDDYDDDFDEEENAMLLKGDDEYVERVAEEIMNR